ncbi:UNVERIFIED_CONTAM: hypothetical protein GTU68_030307 [Idotea baltica]|nr:hypothetical protein [Idotea baltica]
MPARSSPVPGAAATSPF